MKDGNRMAQYAGTAYIDDIVVLSYTSGSAGSDAGDGSTDTGDNNTNGGENMDAQYKWNPCLTVGSVTDTTAKMTFAALADSTFVSNYGITLNEDVRTVELRNVKESTFTLEGAKVNHSGQGTVYLAMPDNIPAGMQMPVVIAIHGSGRGALDYRDTAFYAEQKNIALKNGYIFAAISNGPDTWGLDDGLYNINLLYDYLIANYPIQGKAVLWATSAGGTLANRMVAEHPEKVRCVIGTFPVYDLVSGFNLSSCQSAWGTTDLDTFKTRIAGKNPAEYPEKLNVDYYIAHGSADTAVPLADNSQKMADAVGDNVHLQVVEGGVHGTSNYNFYKGIIKKAFEDYPATYS